MTLIGKSMIVITKAPMAPLFTFYEIYKIQAFIYLLIIKNYDILIKYKISLYKTLVNAGLTDHATKFTLNAFFVLCFSCFCF